MLEAGAKEISEDQMTQVTRANTAAHDKIRNMTASEKADHYRKVMKGCMGFISKGQQEMFDSIAHLGFVDNEQIEHMSVDTCHQEYKIVVEYNGDAYSFSTAIACFALSLVRPALQR